MRSRPLPLFFLLMLLAASMTAAGCFTRRDSCSLTVEPFRVGAAATYLANGTFFPLTETVPVYSGADETLRLNLDSATLNITLLRAENLVSESGILKTGVGIEYETGDLKFLREWLSENSGQLTSRELPSASMIQGRLLQVEYFDLEGHPAFFGHPLLVGHTLAEGTTISHEFMGRKVGEADDKITPLAITFEVQRTQREHAECEVVVEGRVTPSRFAREGSIVSLTLRSDATWPVNIRVSDTKRELTLVLEDSSQGTGLPLVTSIGASDTALPMAASTQGFPSGFGSVFPTSLEKAIQVLQEDQTTGAWLRAHPRSIPVSIIHYMGDQSGGYVDRWTINWYDPESEEGQSMHVARRPPLAGLLEHFTTEMEPKKLQKPRFVADETFRVQDVDAIVRLLHQGPIEFAMCHLYTGDCAFGSNNATGQVNWGSGQSSIGHDGLRVGISGKVIQNNRFYPLEPTWRRIDA